MSRIKLWKDVVDDIRTLADSLEVLVNEMETGGEEAKTEKPAEEKKEEPEKTEPKKTISLEEVRKVLSEKSGAGFTAQVRELLQKHGGSKLSEIKEEEYAGLLADVKEIG